MLLKCVYRIRSLVFITSEQKRDRSFSKEYSNYVCILNKFVPKWLLISRIWLPMYLDDARYSITNKRITRNWILIISIKYASWKPMLHFVCISTLLYRTALTINIILYTRWLILCKICVALLSYGQDRFVPTLKENCRYHHRLTSTIVMERKLS